MFLRKSNSPVTIPSILTNDMVKHAACGRAEQFLRIGARSLAITAEERVGMVRHRLSLGRDRAFAVTRPTQRRVLPKAKCVRT
jgi:hypothetical protein